MLCMMFVSVLFCRFERYLFVGYSVAVDETNEFIYWSFAYTVKQMTLNGTYTKQITSTGKLNEWYVTITTLQVFCHCHNNNNSRPK